MYYCAETNNSIDDRFPSNKRTLAVFPNLGASCRELMFFHFGDQQDNIMPDITQKIQRIQKAVSD